jgi:hypothetical protein
MFAARKMMRSDCSRTNASLLSCNFKLLEAAVHRDHQCLHSIEKFDCGGAPPGAHVEHGGSFSPSKLERSLSDFA